MFGVLSVGDLIAISIAVLTSSVSVAVNLIVQRREDRRALEAETWKRATEKHHRVNAEFHRVILAANVLTSLTAPTLRTPSKYLQDEEREYLQRNVDHAFRDMQQASASLLLDGIGEAVEELEGIGERYADFQHRLFLIGEQKAGPADWQAMNDDADAIAESRLRLEAKLPAVLAAILPDRPQPRLRRRWLPWLRRPSRAGLPSAARPQLP